MEHAVLVGILHANVGNEVGAAILQYTASQFKKTMQIDQHNSCEDKHLENYLMFICQLYAFRVTTDLLVFDILTNLADLFDIKSAGDCHIFLANSNGGGDNDGGNKGTRALF